MEYGMHISCRNCHSSFSIISPAMKWSHGVTDSLESHPDKKIKKEIVCPYCKSKIKITLEIE